MNFSRILRPFLILSLFLSAASGLLLAQATTSLNGRVTDSSGAVVPGATVKVTFQDTGAVRQITTDSSGQFQFSQLEPGRYTLTVSAPQFATAEHSNLDLLVSQPATANIQLQPATVTQQVTVNSSAELLLNTTDATLGNAFDSHQVESLPLDQRNVPDLLSLQPGVTFLGRSDDVTAPRVSATIPPIRAAGAVNGGRSDQSNITLDGVDVNDINNGYAFTSVLRSTQDSVAEFRVTTSNPNARGRPLLWRAGGPGHAQRFERQFTAQSMNTTAPIFLKPTISSTSNRSLPQACPIARQAGPQYLWRSGGRSGNQGPALPVS